MIMKKILLVSLVSLFSLAAIFVGTYYVVKMRQGPNKSSAGSGVTLYFDPQNPTLGLNSNFTLNLKVNPGSEKVSAAELYLTFDKDKLQITSIESVTAFSAGVAPKTFLKDPVTDNSLGKASVIVGVLPEAPVGSISDVVIIKGKTKNVPGNTLISITHDSKAAAINKIPNVNVIETYGQASLNITAPTNTPTPTPTPTVTPTGTPTPTPTGTATSTATPTASPTASPTGSPTGSPSAKVGDVNGDGMVNLIDIGIVVDFYDMDVSLKPKADVNGDGSINLIDIGMIVDRYE